MSKLTKKDISAAMRQIDICMMTTNNGIRLESRPMSNNRDVDYKGSSYFFTDAKMAVVRELEAQPQVNLAFVHHPLILGKPLYLSISGRAELIREKTKMKRHWTKDLDLWFKQGIDTPGLVMIHVKADSLRYWHGMDEGVVKI